MIAILSLVYPALTATCQIEAGGTRLPVTRKLQSLPDSYRPATPRSYQKTFVSGDVFSMMAYMDDLATRQAVSRETRRADMIDQIRMNIIAQRSSLEMFNVGRVLAAMGSIDREAFVPPAQSKYAYLPFPVQIGYGQTISDAYIVAVMTAVAAVSPHSIVLDVGTGSGYQAAVLSRLVSQVTSIEIVKPLAVQARARLRRLGYRNIHVLVGDGFKGVSRNAPYDAIIVAAGTTAVPPALLDQLKIGGRLIIPIGPTFDQERLTLIQKTTTSAYSECWLGDAAFVPMTGKALHRRVIGISDPKRLCYGRPIT